MHKIKIFFCLLLMFFFQTSVFSLSQDFYNKYSGYNVFGEASSEKKDFEFRFLYSSSQKKAKLICINTANEADETVLFETKIPVNWFSCKLIYSDISETIYFYTYGPENDTEIFKYQGLYSCKKTDGKFLAENVNRFFVPAFYMFQNAFDFYLQKDREDLQGLLDYFYSFSDNCEKTFCYKTDDDNLLTGVEALKYCKDSLKKLSEPYDFVVNHVKKIENNQITEKSAVTLNGNPHLAATILNEIFFDAAFLHTTEGIWVLNITNKKQIKTDEKGLQVSSWVPDKYTVFLLEDSKGKIAEETPNVLKSQQFKASGESFNPADIVLNDFLLLQNLQGQPYYAYKNNVLKSFDSFEKSVEYALLEDKSEISEKSLEKTARKSVFIYCLVGFLVLGVLAELFIILFMKSKQYKTHLNKKDKKMIFRIQDQERSKVSKDIHDSVVQNIRAIRLEAEMLEVAENSNLRKQKIIDEMTNVISLLRNICYNLSPAELSLAENTDNRHVELLSVIDTLSKQFTAKTKIPCSISLEKSIVLPELDVEISKNVVRVVQECFHNIEKHSFATRVQILVKMETKDNLKNLMIFIIDDGIGCELSKLTSKKTHFGIRNMMERMKMIGGSIEFFSEPNEGLNIKLQIPCGD